MSPVSPGGFQAVRAAILARLWARDCVSDPGSGAFEGVDSAAVSAVAAFQGADSAFTAGAPFDGSSECPAVFDGLPGLDGSAFAEDDDVTDAEVCSASSTLCSTVMGTKADPRRRTIFYQYRAGRARRTLRGIDQQITKAEKAVAGGPAAIKRWPG